MYPIIKFLSKLDHIFFALIFLDYQQCQILSAFLAHSLHIFF